MLSRVCYGAQEKSPVFDLWPSSFLWPRGVDDYAIIYYKNMDITPDESDRIHLADHARFSRAELTGWIEALWALAKMLEARTEPLHASAAIGIAEALEAGLAEPGGMLAG
jgi:hypothetical protein